MKWKNKGHEFDDVYLNIKSHRKLYLFGAGRDGKAVYDVIKHLFPEDFEILGFLDNDEEKQNKAYCGLPVLSPCDKFSFTNDTAVVITIVGAKVFKSLKEQLERMGLKENVNCFHSTIFLSVYASYAKNILFFHNVSFLPSTRCNLRCKACLNFTPYMSNFEERSWSQVKDDVDLFFNTVDYIELFHVSGGEPFLYPHLAKLLAYIDDCYGDRIHSLETVTNGTVLPPKEFLDVYRNVPITVTVDDYREAIPNMKERFNEVVNRLEGIKGKGKYVIQHYDEWIDLSPFYTDNSSWTAEKLEKYFNDCHALLQEFRGGKLYLCNYAAYAAVAGVIDELPATDVYDFCNYKKEHLKELMEFRLGYSERGYTEFCKRCAGLFEINPHKVFPAEQM